MTSPTEARARLEADLASHDGDDQRAGVSRCRMLVDKSDLRLVLADPTATVEVEPTLHSMGWAPGDYIFTCLDCCKQGVGAKRSLRCEDCAREAVRTAALRPTEASPAVTVEEIDWTKWEFDGAQYAEAQNMDGPMSRGHIHPQEYVRTIMSAGPPLYTLISEGR